MILASRMSPNVMSNWRPSDSFARSQLRMNSSEPTGAIKSLTLPSVTVVSASTDSKVAV